jgi:hypothetical protein
MKDLIIVALLVCCCCWVEAPPAGASYCVGVHPADCPHPGCMTSRNFSEERARQREIGLLLRPIIGAASAIFLVVPTFANDPGSAVCMAFGVVLLPVIPFAIRRAHQTHVRAFLVTLGAGLLAYNFENCLDALNRGHAAAVSARLGAQSMDCMCNHPALTLS